MTGTFGSGPVGQDEKDVSQPSDSATGPAVNSDRYIHSDIYDRLVDDADDLIGLVAYGLYQAEKRRWITQYQTLHGGLPSEPEIKSFCFAYDDIRLAKLQAESEEVIFRATEERVAERQTEMTKYAFNVRTIQELGKLDQAIRETSGYRHHVIAHLMSFAILVGTYYFITFAATHEPTILGLFGAKQPEAK